MPITLIRKPKPTTKSKRPGEKPKLRDAYFARQIPSDNPKREAELELELERIRARKARAAKLLAQGK